MGYGKLFIASCLSLFVMGVQADNPVALGADYTIEASWPTGYQVTATLTNNNDNPTTSWQSMFTLGQGQSITNLWNGEFTANGQNITATNPTWAGGEAIPAHGSATFGFIVNNPQGSVQALNNLQATGTVTAGCYCPPALPVPNAPVLDAIQVNQGSYTVSWNSVPNTASYTLQRSLTSDFANPMVVAQGFMQSQAFDNQQAGTYFYRVSASNAAGVSAFSNVQSTTVAPQEQGNQLVEASWDSSDSSISLNDIVNMHADIIDVAFAGFEKTGDHSFDVVALNVSDAQLAQLVSLAHNAGKKVKISIGGPENPLSHQLLSNQDAMGMAQAVAIYVQQNHLDGVDFDIEDQPAPALQVELLKNTRQLLTANAIRQPLMDAALISYRAKAPASSTYPYNEVIRNAHQYLDAIPVSIYNYAPGYQYQQDVQSLMGFGVPMSKISLELMPGMDNEGINTAANDITAVAQYAQQNGLAGVALSNLNRDFSNATGLGANVATNAVWSVFHP